MLLYCPPSTAGFFSFSRRWRPTAEIAKDQIASLYASMNRDSRYDVVSFVSIAESRVANFYFHHFPLAELPHSSHRRVALRSPATSSAGSSISRKSRQHSAEFARRSMEIPMAVQPSSVTARERRQGVRAVAVVMATKHSVANKRRPSNLGRRVLLESPPRTKRVLCRDVPSVDQLISMTNSSVTSVLAPSPPNLSPDIDKPPNVKGVAAESIAGERPCSFVCRGRRRRHPRSDDAPFGCFQIADGFPWTLRRFKENIAISA